MEAYTISERKYKLEPQSESYFPVIILYSSRASTLLKNLRGRNVARCLRLLHMQPLTTGTTTWIDCQNKAELGTMNSGLSFYNVYC